MKKQKLKKTKAVPIIFLHGWGGDVSSFKFCKKFLAENVTCIYLDFPPFGRSSKLYKPLKIEDYANIVVKLLNKLKIDKVNIVAHSFGGRVALLLASRFTSRVNKMLLTGCAGIRRKELKIRLRVVFYKLKKFLNKLGLYPCAKLQNQGTNDYKNLNVVMKQTFNNIIGFDERFLLKDITCETLFIWGKLDKETPFYFTKIFKKHIKNSEVIVFENCGHFAYLEKPKTFLLILKKFFNVTKG